MELRAAIESRHSIRRFDGRPVSDEILIELCALALHAPAPHHTKPWRFAIVSAERRASLAEEMGAAWRRDLEADGQPRDLIDGLLERSRRQLVEPPGLILAAAVGSGLRDWPDERRRTAEWQMAAHSVGAGLQNVMLAATDLGLGSFWISAPLFAQEAVQKALDLPPDWRPQALLAIGYPSPEYRPRPRTVDAGSAVVIR